MPLNSHNVGLGAAPELTPEQLAQARLNTSIGLVGMTSTMPGGEKFLQGHIQQTVKQWTESARPGVQKSIPILERAIAGIAQLPVTVRGYWQGRMQLLRQYATANPPDPITIIRYINHMQRDVDELSRLAIPGTPAQVASLGVPPPGLANPVVTDVPTSVITPGGHPSVKLIQETLQTFRANIGTLHPHIQYTDRHANRDLDMAARERNVILTGVFLVAIGGAILTTALNLMRPDDKRNWTLPMIYFAVAALALGWGDLTRNGTENLRRQIGWLTMQDGWDALQAKYAIGGPDWSTFAQTLYTKRGTDPKITLAMTSSQPVTEDQKKAVLAHTPAGIREKVEAMLDSAGPPKGKDFKTFSTFLSNAVTPDARDIVLAYLHSGTNRHALAMLAQQPGAQDKAKKAAAASGGPATGPAPLPPAPVPPTATGGLGGSPVV